MSLKKINHSIRDPQGFVFEYEGEVYRCIRSKYSSFFNNLLDNLFIKKLNGNSLINTEKIYNSFYKISDEISKNDIILKHKKLPIITKPYEWSFDQLKDAAIFHLNFEQGLLKNGLCLKDASAYNVSFFNNQPVFIDFLSINKYDEGSFWAGYKQFINQFLNPLLLKSLLNLNFHNFYKSDQDGFHTSDLSKLLKLKHYFSYNVF